MNRQGYDDDDDDDTLVVGARRSLYSGVTQRVVELELELGCDSMSPVGKAWLGLAWLGSICGVKVHQHQHSTSQTTLLLFPVDCKVRLERQSRPPLISQYS